MPSNTFHNLALTSDLDATVAFLADVVGVSPIVRARAGAADLVRLLGFPEDSPDSEVAQCGEGRGMIEVIQIPAAVADQVKPRWVFASYATADVEGKAEAARASGLAVHGPFTALPENGIELTAAIASVGGLDFELVRFAAPS
jgi:hypothetical protein